MPCTESNGFFPDLPTRKVDLIYICSPNNPTGAVATKEQLKKFVDYANEYKAVIFFDSAYAAFITDPDLPRSIYEVEGAENCSIEFNSFSKTAGFTKFASHGQSYPKPVVPRILVPVSFIHFGLAGKTPSSMEHQTLFKQCGGAALSTEGRQQTDQQVAFYLENAKIINDGLTSLGITTYGGGNAPYVWLKTLMDYRLGTFSISYLTNVMWLEPQGLVSGLQEKDFSV